MSYWDNNDLGQPAEDDDPRMVRLSRDQIRALERDAGKARDAEVRAEQAERRVAIMQAGIDLNAPLGQFFAENYKGDLKTATILSEAERLGITAGAPSTQEPATPSEPESQSTPEPSTPPVPAATADLRESLAQGATNDATGLPQKSAADEAISVGNTMLSQGRSRESAIGAAFHELIGSALGGDESVVINQFAPRV